MHKSSVILFSFIFIVACNPQEINIEKEIQPVLRSNWNAFIDAWEKEDAATSASLYLEDGINIPPQLKENNGRKEIEEFYQFLFDNNLKSDYTHDIISIDGNNENIIERGKFSVDWTRNDSTTWTYYARSLTHWKNTDGKWMIKSFVFNNPPAD